MRIMQLCQWGSQAVLKNGLKAAQTTAQALLMLA